LSDIIQFINGVPQTNKKLNGYYEIKKKQERNGKFLAKYWKLLEFTAFNMPHGATIEIDLSNATKELLHETTKSSSGIESVSFAKMSEEEFGEHYSRVVDQCCSMLRTTAKKVLDNLVGFF